MSDFYINAKVYGDNILYTGIKNGKKIRTKIPYSPSLFVPTNEETPYKTLYGENLKKVKMGTIKKAKEFVKQYETVGNFRIFGNTRFEYCAISDLFPDKVDWDFSKIRIGIVDIEVDSDPSTGGFASPQDPFQPIISIAYKIFGEDTTYVFGYYDFKAPNNVTYIKCQDEYTLIKKFIDVWSFDYPDIISGWNVEGFDIPYIVNRFNKIVTEKETKRLSPWSVIQEIKSRKFNQKFNRYEEEYAFKFLGVSTVDYLDLYKKYQPGGNSQDSYRLDNIAEVEIGEKKIEYSGSLHKLYQEDKQKFYEYNIQDVILIEKMDEKCKLFSLGLTLSYNSKTNYDDIFQQTRMWDSLVYDFLKKKGIQVPQNGVKDDQAYEGAYVKSPIIGMHKWIVTIDATSLYPSIIMGKNISPETIVDPADYTQDMRDILSQPISVDNLLAKKIDLSKLKENNVTIAPNGQFFRTDKKGFLPQMVEELFAKRQEYKKTMIEYQKEYEKVSLEDPNSEHLNEISFEIAKYNNLQNAMKLCLNSLYGCLGTKYFRFFDVRQAEAITLEGQLSNRWVANGINKYLNKILKSDKDYVIGGDTDSLFLSLGGLVEKVCPKDMPPEQIIDFLIKSATVKIQPEVDSLCGELGEYLNSFDDKLKYKLEKICSNSIFVAKKRYALNVYSNEGVVYNEPKIKVTGLQIIQSSTPALVRKALKECIKFILDEEKDQLQSFVASFKRKFFDFTPEEISYSRGVNGIGKYQDSVFLYKKGTPIHVRGSIIFNNSIKEYKLDHDYEFIKDGDKIKFCYLKLPNPLKENVLAFPEKIPDKLNIHNYIDYGTMWDKAFIEPLKSITDIIDWDLEKRNSLEDFF